LQELKEEKDEVEKNIERIAEEIAGGHSYRQATTYVPSCMTMWT